MGRKAQTLESEEIRKQTRVKTKRVIFYRGRIYFGLFCVKLARESDHFLLQAFVTLGLLVLRLKLLSTLSLTIYISVCTVIYAVLEIIY